MSSVAVHYWSLRDTLDLKEIKIWGGGSSKMKSKKLTFAIIESSQKLLYPTWFFQKLFCLESHRRLGGFEGEIPSIWRQQIPLKNIFYLISVLALSITHFGYLRYLTGIKFSICQLSDTKMKGLHYFSIQFFLLLLIQFKIVRIFFCLTKPKNLEKSWIRNKTLHISIFSVNISSS